MAQDAATIIGIIILAVIAGFCLWRFEQAVTQFDLIKRGFQYVVSILLLINMMQRKID